MSIVVGRKPQTPEEKEQGIFYYYVDTSDSNSATLAGTRQGKGIFFVDPFIDILTRARLIANRASFVMTATKGDEPRKWYKTSVFQNREKAMIGIGILDIETLFFR
ncbi:hypothetical protein EfmAA290_18930 [Enterococcus faecium]|nr:hypothetical protein EfmAA290_18930 [Enterococcus faecium]